MSPASSKDTIVVLVPSVHVDVHKPEHFVSCYPAPKAGARGCALSHLILQPTTRQDPPKPSAPQHAGCPYGDPSCEEALGYTMSQTRSTCRDFSESSISAHPPLTPSICPFTSPTHPTSSLCYWVFAEDEATAAPSTNPFQQVQPGGRSSTRVHQCKLAVAPAELQARASPLQELVCILGRMLKNISDPQTFTF